MKTKAYGSNPGPARACPAPIAPRVRQCGAGATGRPVIHRSEATMLPSSGCLWICHCGNSIINPVSPPAAPSRPHWNKEEVDEMSGLRSAHLTERKMIVLWVIWPSINSALHLSPLVNEVPQSTTWGSDWSEGEESHENPLYCVQVQSFNFRFQVCSTYTVLYIFSNIFI